MASGKKAVLIVWAYEKVDRDGWLRILVESARNNNKVSSCNSVTNFEQARLQFIVGRKLYDMVIFVNTDQHSIPSDLDALLNKKKVKKAFIRVHGEPNSGEARAHIKDCLRDPS